jgi:GTP-binding protein
LHLIDGTSEKVAQDYATIIGELGAYSEKLAAKPRVTILNKIDALDDEQRQEARAALEEASGGPVMMMSSVAKQGVTEVLRKLRSEIDDHHKRLQPAQEEEAWHP